MNRPHKLLLFKRLSSFSKNVSNTNKRYFYEQTKSGSVAFEERKEKILKGNKTEAELMVEHAKDMKHDIKWFWNIVKDRTVGVFRSDNKRVCFEDQELVKFWDFNQHNNNVLSSYDLDYKKDKFNDMNNWQVTCDADFDVGEYYTVFVVGIDSVSGFSRCSWTVSPAGRALFSGYLDTTVPKTGKVVRSGYAFLESFKSRKPFYGSATHPILEQFTHIELNVRGDGRRYFLIFDTSEDLDITWFNKHQFMIYTHGGPYWQRVKVRTRRFWESFF